MYNQLSAAFNSVSQLDMVFGAYDQVLCNGAWLEPKMYLTQSTKYKPRTPRKIEEDKYTHEWSVTERDDGRKIIIGSFQITSLMFVEPVSPTSYSAAIMNIKYRDEEYSVIIPERDFKRRNILSYLPFIERNPDCPDKYLTDALYLGIQNAPEIKFFVIPKRSGFCATEDDKLFFACKQFIYRGLEQYYPIDICERILIETTRSIIDISSDYFKTLPRIWQFKLFVAIRIASLILYFAAEAGIVPDQLFVVETASDSASKLAVSLLKTQNYSSQVTTSLLATKTEIKTYMNNINDGIVLLSDNAYAEDWKKRNENICFALDDLQNKNGEENNPRHLTGIILERPGNILQEIPAMHINISNVICAGNPDDLQNLSGEFDSALINAFQSDPINMRAMLQQAFEISAVESKTISNSENVNFKRLVRAGVFIMEKYDLITPDETKEIHQWLKNGYESSGDSATNIVNDVRDALNSILFKNVRVVTQFGEPFYVIGKRMAFTDGEYINFEGDVWDSILCRMRTTKKRLKAINALKSCGLIHANNGLKRNLEVETAPGILKTVNVFSISKKMLNTDNLEKINELTFGDYLLNHSEASNINLRPMLINRSGFLYAGQKRDKDENYHQDVSGKPRSGKSKYLCEQSVEAAKNGEQVLILDNNNSYSEKEIRKHLSDKVFDKYFGFWNIHKQGLPVNLADLSNCDTFTDKKQRIHSILAAGARSLGDTQDRVLKKKVKQMLKENETEVDIIDILYCFPDDKNLVTILNTQFEIDQYEALQRDRPNCTEKICEKGISNVLDYLSDNDKTERALRTKFEDIFEDLKDLPKSSSDWGGFFSTQKKIVVVSTGTDGTAKGSHLIDMLLSSIYSYQQYHADKHITLVLDECQDLYLVKDGPIDIILRKGGKSGIRVLLASQEFSADKNGLGKIIGNCGTLVFFSPKTNNLTDISKLTGIDKTVLANLEQGQCVIYGLLYNKNSERNKHTTVIGWTFKHGDM